jgi:hypothetical protein
MKPLIAALAATFLLASAGTGFAQTTPTTPPAKMEKQQKKGSSSRAAVDCKKAENSNNKACMDAAKGQTAAGQKTKKNAPKTN